jgi:hypothetical protein
MQRHYYRLLKYQMKKYIKQEGVNNEKEKDTDTETTERK